MGGISTLQDWYQTFNSADENQQSILKGSMIQLASNYGISDDELL
jgi:hypothetical protein